MNGPRLVKQTIKEFIEKCNGGKRKLGIEFSVWVEKSWRGWEIVVNAVPVDPEIFMVREKTWKAKISEASKILPLIQEYLLRAEVDRIRV